MKRILKIIVLVLPLIAQAQSTTFREQLNKQRDQLQHAGRDLSGCIPSRRTMEALCGGTSSEFLNLVDVLSITSRVSEVVNIMAIQWVDLDRGNFKTQEAKSATRGMLEFEQATVIGLLNDAIFAADLALKNTVDPDNLKKITRARDAVQATSVLLNNVNFLAGESFYRN